ncbi:PREDICTED: platelet glycoprotein Ib alpha chain-like isoform X4 [Nicrophorus vespilloides]|uniref:Platelet glycoprotein Ib alpha chain-like isoform X4 n=1 Tax=Nicrophorus vespilloides TaxID=110193 RepID=A0ABM1MK04_NICVS|nr:PREDICTED: platelet glycoprotein Ib alpha chain-like isoform X4 [Nicrophorus vespilloides]
MASNLKYIFPFLIPLLLLVNIYSVDSYPTNVNPNNLSNEEIMQISSPTIRRVVRRIGTVPTNYTSPNWVRPTPATMPPKRDFVSIPKTNLVGPSPMTPKSTTPTLQAQPKRDFVSPPPVQIVTPSPTTPKTTTTVKPIQAKSKYFNPRNSTPKPIQSAIKDFVANEARQSKL